MEIKSGAKTIPAVKRELQQQRKEKPDVDKTTAKWNRKAAVVRINQAIDQELACTNDIEDMEYIAAELRLKADSFMTTEPVDENKFHVEV